MTALDLSSYVPVTRWECPNCNQKHVTKERLPHSPFHSCTGLKGITSPFVPEGTSCKIEAKERDDYVGAEIAHLDADGRAVMSVVTTRDEGQDCAVLVPLAVGSRE